LAPHAVPPLARLHRTLERLNSDATVTYNDRYVIADAAELAESSDVVVLMVGDNSRETIDLPVPLAFPSVTGTNQEMLIPAILEANPNTVVVLKTQGMALMPWLGDAPALLEAWYPGQDDGDVVADALFGVTNPSGKLPMTFGNSAREAAYSSEAQYLGLHEDTGVPGGPGFDPTGGPQLVTRYTENLQMGYRWYEANQVRPVFPFGFGLSYTTFRYSDLQVDVTGSAADAVATVSYTLTNTGNRFGKEASQVYL